MIQIINKVFIDPNTLEVYDQQMGNSIITQSDVQKIKDMVREDVTCRVPDSVIVYDYLQWHTPGLIQQDLEIHVERIQRILELF
jgi:hypothetical protein